MTLYTDPFVPDLSGQDEIYNAGSAIYLAPVLLAGEPQVYTVSVESAASTGASTLSLELTSPSGAGVTVTLQKGAILKIGPQQVRVTTTGKISTETIRQRIEGQKGK